jgi:hypothetical protein
MKRYIKVNAKNEIIDIFHENNIERFDGSEIFFDNVIAQDVHINGTCISDEFGFPLYKYVSGKVSSATGYEDQRAAKISEKARQAKIAQLTATDSNMPRITEDIIDLLISKKVIKKIDMPAEVQEKLDERKALRALIG